MCWLKIINALRRKITLAPDVDVDEFARVTDGYSGADLQALVYNAHLNAVHESISETGARNAKTAIVADSTQPVPFTTFGGPEDQTTLSYAEQSVRDRRVRAHCPRNAWTLTGFGRWRP